MKEKVTTPEIVMIAGTRVVLGAGVGLLLADKMNTSKRQRVGWTMLAVGAATTIPLLMRIRGRKKSGEHQFAA